MKVHSILLGLVVLLSSCATKKPVSNESSRTFVGQKWEIKSVAGNEIKGLVNGKLPYLIFDSKDSRYSVNTGCNTLNGQFSLKGTNLKMNGGISTMMFCENMVVEDGFKSIIPQVSSFKMANNSLVLLNGNKELAVLEKLATKEASNLVGTSWKLDLLAIPGANTKELFESTMPTLIFAEDGKVSGHASCNRFNSSFKVDGNFISFGPFMTTKMMCPTLKGEQLFLETLGKVNGFSQSNGVLTLLIGDIAVMRMQQI